METTVRVVLGLLAAASVVAAGVSLAAWQRVRQERRARDEAVRRARRRATLSGQWDPLDESGRSLLQSGRSPLGSRRSALRSLLAGAVVGAITFAALPAATSEVRPETRAAGDSTPAAAGATSTTVLATPTTGPTRTATPRPTATATASPTPPSTDVSTPQSFVIANTGGIGVWVRTACEKLSRTTVAWPEGRRVQTVDTGAADCSGWRLVELQGVQSWVEERYLLPLPPP